MLTERDGTEERKILEELIGSNSELKLQHELFQEEMRFKQMLIDARKSKRMTQKDVSEMSGLSQQAVSRLERGHGGTIDTVIKYLHSVGMTLRVQDI